MLLPLLRRILTGSLLLLLAGPMLGPGVCAQAVAPAKTVLPGCLVFKLKPGHATPPPALRAALARLGAMSLRPKYPHSRPPGPDQPGAVDLSRLYQVTLPAEVRVAEACQTLRKTGAVDYAEPLYSYPPLAQPSDPLADSTRSGGQYHLKNIQAYRAWNITKGDTSLLIGIIDGGTRLTHEDLASQFQPNRLDPIDGLDNDNDGYVDNYSGWDFADADNNPGRDPRSVHGILVAGCAAGATDNGKGIAGVGYQCRFLPLKIFPSTATGSFAGYEAIVYAADHGCQVINLSWGAPGGYSQYEQDVINYAAINHDVVVVAAAGNTPAELDFYPASYDNVLSVAFTSVRDERSSSATYSRRIDLSAPGVSVLTTWGDTDSDYVAVTGSSFAAPLVAGAAGLVRTRFPQFTAAQVAAQLRRTTDNVDALPGNVAYAGRLGSGRLNVYRAVTEAQYSARIQQTTYVPDCPAYGAGDTMRLAVRVQNLLQPLNNLTVKLTSLSAYLTVRQDSFAVGPLVTLEQRANERVPFRLEVASSVPSNTRAVLRFRLRDAATGYQEDQYETVLLNPNYVVLEANNLSLTLTGRGNIGYDGLNTTAGWGVRYLQGPPLLSEGGLLLGTSATRVSDNVRSTPGQSNTDFSTLAHVAYVPGPPRADQEAVGRLRDALPTVARPRAVGVHIRQHALAWTAAPHQDYVVLDYRLTNLTADTLKPLRLGLFMDWDLPGEPARNVAAWDSVRQLGYVYDPVTAGQYTGVQLLTGGTPSAYAIDNQAPAGAEIRLADGFSTAEKWLALSSGTTHAASVSSTGTDISQVIGARLPYLAPADSATVVFAVLAAPSLAQLQAAADAARTRYQQVLPVRSAATLPGVLVYPNPTAGQLRLTLPGGLTGVQILSVLGQELGTYSFHQTTATLDLSTYPAGVYLVKIRNGQRTATYRVLRQP
ncbi:S8 family serine peptidase [Hymenobacter sp. NST-14]|uniref:S8 family serine peptidase n=1 Tax=Hymenobacter piscis TaxID=2839984 RepID=UPI001C011B7E|nr:S8 family serine peptidase [Hymenobacter piscis]MBT9393836.1 S8 family serine peptidase [Hymenobacter piscis]